MSTRAWAAIHETRTALMLTLLTLALTVLGRHRLMPSALGLDAPEQVPVELLLPAVAAVAVASALTTDTPRAPDALGARRSSLRAVRSLWSHAWLMSLIALTLTAGRLIDLVAATTIEAGATSLDLAIIVNTLLLAGMSITAVAAGAANRAWIAPFALVVATMTFGGSTSGDGYRRWARLADPDVSPVRITVSLTVWFAAVLLYCGRGGYRTR